MGGWRSAHPDFLGQVLNRRQVLEWMAYSKLFPFGSERQSIEFSHQTYWIRDAILTAMTEGHDEEKPTMFMPKFDNESPKSEAQLIADKIQDSL